MHEIKQLPPTNVLWDRFTYNPLTGELLYRMRCGRISAGTPAGTTDESGYRRVIIDKIQYMVHRIVWKWVTGAEPVGVVDHKNKHTSDNSFSNLRETTYVVNALNNSTPGYYYSQHRARWVANLAIGGKTWRRYCATEELARAAAKALRDQHCPGARL